MPRPHRLSYCALADHAAWGYVYLNAVFVVGVDRNGDFAGFRDLHRVPCALCGVPCAEIEVCTYAFLFQKVDVAQELILPVHITFHGEEIFFQARSSSFVVALVERFCDGCCF